MKLLLELQQLLAGEGCPPPPCLARAEAVNPQGAASSLHVQRPVTLLILVTAAQRLAVLGDICKIEREIGKKPYSNIKTNPKINI